MKDSIIDVMCRYQTLLHLAKHRQRFLLSLAHTNCSRIQAPIVDWEGTEGSCDWFLALESYRV